MQHYPSKASLKLVRTMVKLAFTIVATSCGVDWGPLGTPEFDNSLRSSILGPSESLEFSASSEWFNADGFQDVRQRWGTQEMSYGAGVLVLTNLRLLLLTWNRERKAYRVLLSLPYPEIASARLDRSLKLSTIVIQLDDGSCYYTFNILSGRDEESTSRAVAMIQAQLSAPD